MNIHITRKTVAELEVSGKDYFIWDANLKGFGVRVSPKGKKVFVVQTRIRGKLKRTSLGAYPTLSVTAAKKAASKYFEQVSLRNNGVKTISSPSKITLREFVDQHWTSISRTWRPSTEHANGKFYERSLLPIFGDTALIDISRPDIITWFASMKKTPGAANRTIPVLKAILKLAISLEIIPNTTNPAAEIPRYKGKKFDRILSNHEMYFLGRALKERTARKPTEVNVILMVILTGCRISEVSTMEWANLQTDRIFLPHTKTGPLTLYLSRYARAVIEMQRKLPQSSNWIFPNPNNIEQSMPSVWPFWSEVRKEARITDVRIHDLRHNFASWAAMSGIDLFTVGKMLGHKDVASTNRYIHYASASLKEPTFKVQKEMSRLINGGGYDNA